MSSDFLSVSCYRLHTRSALTLGLALCSMIWAMPAAFRLNLASCGSARSPMLGASPQRPTDRHGRPPWGSTGPTQGFHAQSRKPSQAAPWPATSIPVPPCLPKSLHDCSKREFDDLPRSRPLPETGHVTPGSPVRPASPSLRDQVT
jgi:hypothetical protein